MFADYEGTKNWEPLPPLPPEQHVNLRSILYALEWWVFGGFAVFIAVRWIRDNGRSASSERERSENDTV